MNSEYWNKFYSGTFTLDIPSQFCAMFCQEAKRGSKVVEFGCGNGRDSRVMASHGFRVLGVDASESAIAYCNEHASDNLGKSLQYLKSDVTKLDMEVVRSFVGGDPFYLYSRFFQHSITDDEQDWMLKTLSSISYQSVTAYFEFRNDKDRDTQKIFGDHYRRYQSTGHFVDVLARYGFEIAYYVEGKGLAKYFDEDPNVSRVIARINRGAV
jgi:SAM-dependent methyltransferase